MHGTPSGAPLGLPTEPPGPEALHALLTVSLTALTVLQPLYRSGTGELTDFTCAYLNPAGQRMLSQPERPEETFLALLPNARENGLFAFYRRVFETGEPGRFEVNYQADGLDNYFYVGARRQGEQLTASFTDTASQGRTAVEAALLRAGQPQLFAQQAQHRRARVDGALHGLAVDAHCYGHQPGRRLRGEG